MDQLAHIQVLASFWMPVAMLGLHRYYRDGRAWWLMLFAGATAMQGLTNGYYLLFFPVLVVLWVLWFTPNEGWWRKVGAVGVSGALASLVVRPDPAEVPGSAREPGAGAVAAGDRELQRRRDGVGERLVLSQRVELSRHVSQSGGTAVPGADGGRAVRGHALAGHVVAAWSRTPAVARPASGGHRDRAPLRRRAHRLGGWPLGTQAVPGGRSR